MNVTISNADTRNVTVMADPVISNTARSSTYPSYMRENDFTSSMLPFLFRETTGGNIEGNSGGTYTISMSAASGVIGIATCSLTPSKAYPRIGIYDAYCAGSGNSVDGSNAFGYGEMQFDARIMAGTFISATSFLSAGYSFTHAGAHSVPGEDNSFQSGCCFYADNSSANWQIAHGSNSTISYINTGVSYDAYRLLKIIVSADGNTASFYIDGNLVETLTDPGDGSVYCRDTFRACVECRDRQASSASGIGFTIDYMRNACYRTSR